MVTIYIRLLDEGTDVTRPTKAEEIASGIFRVIQTPNYDPEDEHWEFPPGAIVRSEERQFAEGKILLAVERVQP